MLRGVAGPSGPRYNLALKLTLEFDRDIDGRWIAYVPELAGVQVSGGSGDQVLAKVLSLAYTVLAYEGAYGSVTPKRSWA